MKTLNKRIFLTYPVALMAAVVGMNRETSTSDYTDASNRVVDYFNNLENDSPAEVRNFPCLALFSRKELQMILKYVRNKFGRITSFVSAKAESEKTSYQMECALGTFKMILQTSSENRITSIELIREGNAKSISFGKQSQCD